VDLYYPEIKKRFRQAEDDLVQTMLDRIFSVLISIPTKRQELEQVVWQAFPEEAPPPYTDEQLKTFLKRWMMPAVHLLLGSLALEEFQDRKFHFKNYYHPFVYDFAKLVYNPLKDIPALMSRETQLKDSGFSFDQSYQPTNVVVKLPPQYPSLPDCYPREVVDFYTRWSVFTLQLGTVFPRPFTHCQFT
jgi:hypothetical protein